MDRPRLDPWQRFQSGYLWEKGRLAHGVLARRRALRSGARLATLWRVCWLITSLALFHAEDGAAYPWMIKHSYAGCSECHADPSGGEQLTAYGRARSYETLSTDWGADGSSRPPGYAGPWFGAFDSDSAFAPGGSLRSAMLTKPSADDPEFRVFPMQLDLSAVLRIAGALRAAASVGAARVPAGSPHARAAQVTRGQDESLELISRTHWLGYDFSQGAHMLRLGRLNLPYGLRIPEHVSWVREQTQTDRESDQQHGLALAMGFETLRFEIMAILGNYQIRPDEFRERGYSGFAEVFLADRTAVGLSSLTTFARNDRLEPGAGDTLRVAHGLTLRQGIADDFALLVELSTLLRSRRNLGHAGLAQLDYEPLRGVHLIGSLETFDAGKPREDGALLGPGRGEAKFGGWLSLQWFFIAHFDVRVDAIFRQHEPFQLLAQFHSYL